MTSYYKTIKGKQYDKAMLELADKSVNKKKDGRISISDAKKIIGLASDAEKITETEARTLNFIQDSYNFTVPASEYFKNFLLSEHKDISDKIIVDNKIDNDVSSMKGFLVKYYPLIIILFLILILLYINFDKLNFSCNKSDQKASISTPSEKTVNVPEVTIESRPNEYIVKEKDSLIGISQKLYGDYSKWKVLYDNNKDIIKNPTIIYPGQKLKTDVK